MFYYYGRKGQVAHRYPPPSRDIVVEPFAGSAAYAHRHLAHLRQVVLVERDPTVCAMWRQILEPSQSVDDLCPPLDAGDDTTNLFHIAAAASGGGPYGRLKATPFMAVNVARFRARLARDLARWRAVEVTLIEGDYRLAPDLDATWFIDPPYQGHAGSLYRHGSTDIDYPVLAAWCRARVGQTIVCEGEGADWLPFAPLTDVVGIAGKRNREMVWYGGHPFDHGRLVV